MSKLDIGWGDPFGGDPTDLYEVYKWGKKIWDKVKKFKKHIPLTTWDEYVQFGSGDPYGAVMHKGKRVLGEWVKETFDPWIHDEKDSSSSSSGEPTTKKQKKDYEKAQNYKPTYRFKPIETSGFYVNGKRRRQQDWYVVRDKRYKASRSFRN